MVIINISLDKINSLLNVKDYKTITALLNDEFHSADVANLLENVTSKETLLLLFKLLKKDNGAEVFSYLNHEKQQELVESLTDRELSTIIKQLYIDDAVDFVEEMPANVVERVLKNTNAETRQTINTFLNYPQYSAGSIMTTEFVDLKSDMTVEKAFSRIRRIGQNKETINTCYITSNSKVLQGVLSIRDLLLADPKASLSELMTTNVVSVNTYDDQEQIAQLFSKYDFSILPVTDKERRLVGIVTIDDVIDIIQQENTEDFEKMAAISPTDNTYLKTSVITHAKKRIGWLIFLMLSTIITSAIITSYEQAFVVVPSLVAFLPMIMGTGGNSGSQASTLMIRGLALNEVSIKDFFKIFYKEFFVSIIVGGSLAIINFLRIWLINGEILLGFTVSATLLLTVMIAKFIGFSLPLVAKSLKLDPALMAAPIISTIVDTLSMVSYFYLATVIFGL